MFLKKKVKYKKHASGSTVSWPGFNFLVSWHHREVDWTDIRMVNFLILLSARNKWCLLSIISTNHFFKKNNLVLKMQSVTVTCLNTGAHISPELPFGYVIWCIRYYSFNSVDILYDWISYKYWATFIFHLLSKCLSTISTGNYSYILIMTLTLQKSCVPAIKQSMIRFLSSRGVILPLLLPPHPSKVFLDQSQTVFRDVWWLL